MNIFSIVLSKKDNLMFHYFYFYEID
jgi:hypothetical protein